ncbi:unnamed protein product [Auanema sp. JU1783]|nr:unnamed protein product [Auanema sp. JU1783]
MTINRDFIEICNDEGLIVTVSSYGATLVSVKFPDIHGNMVDCVLGFDSKKDYYDDVAYLGRTVGRVCNRIKNGQFKFHEKEYHLPINNPPNFIHGGSNGIALREWEVARKSNSSCTFRIQSDESLDGLPGDAMIEVSYTINDRNQLVIEHFATCTTPGILNLTNHTYWNLDNSDTIHNHKIQVHSHEYLPVDDNCCPTGGQLLSRGTPLDFNNEKKLLEVVDQNGLVDIDNDLVVDKSRIAGCSILSLKSEESGIQLDISSSYPVIHLYGAKHLNTVGKNGKFYGAGSGLAIEPQYHSCAVNFPNYPSIEFTPDKSYSEEIVYSFFHIK